MDVRQRITKNSAEIVRKLNHHIRQRQELCIVKAPPGSGKTYTLVNAVAYAAKTGQRVAIGAQTNAQTNDLCRRLVAAHPNLKVCRFAARGSEPPDDLDQSVVWCTSSSELPSDNSVVVSTVAKWSLSRLGDSYDILFVDEAWQMSWGDFMLLQQVAPRFVLIGDPGQIPPVVTIPVLRWETSPRAPHRSAPELLMEDPGLPKLALDLPACRRLPCDSVEIVRHFYDFEFDAWAMPGERFCRGARPRKSEGIDRAIDVLSESSVAIATLPTPPNGPPLDDTEIVELAARFAKRLLQRKLSVASDEADNAMPLTASDIGISATHRIINSSIMQALPSGLRDATNGIRVDTPERWQGLERKLMIVVHPLSGVIRPSSFDLETGRLCVMASRHRSGLIVISRDHVPAMLDSYIPSATQAIGRADITGKGHFQNSVFWQSLADANRVVEV